MAEAAPMVQLMVQTSRTWGTRVWPDGRVDEYSDRQVEFEDGAFKSRAVPLAWRPLTRLSADEIQRLRGLIQGSDVFGLPGRLDAAPAEKDGATTSWTIDLDGRRHTVVARGAQSSRHDTLEALRRAVEEMTAVALRRENDPEGDAEDG